MTHTPTLKPCPNPWCEADEREGDFSPEVRPTSFGNWQVCCTSCQQKGPVTTNEPHAITAWNTRTVEAGGVQELVSVAREAQYIVSQYRSFLETITSAEFDLHPYIPSVEDADEKLLAELSKWEASK